MYCPWLEWCTSHLLVLSWRKWRWSMVELLSCQEGSHWLQKPHFNWLLKLKRRWMLASYVNVMKRLTAPGVSNKKARSGARRLKRRSKRRHLVCGRVRHTYCPTWRLVITNPRLHRLLRPAPSTSCRTRLMLCPRDHHGVAWLVQRSVPEWPGCLLWIFFTSYFTLRILTAEFGVLK